MANHVTKKIRGPSGMKIVDASKKIPHNSVNECTIFMDLEVLFSSEMPWRSFWQHLSQLWNAIAANQPEIYKSDMLIRSQLT